MGRNHFAGSQGDAINAVLAAAGYNFRLLLKWLALLCAFLRLLFVAATRLSWVGGSGEGQGGSTALESWQNGVMGAVGRTPHDRHRPVRRCFDAGSVSARLEAREEDQVVGYDRGPDVGLEVVKAAPGATRQAVGALQA